MSGPVERSESRTTEVGGLTVRRALPRRGRRTVGAWCFVDHFGPAGAEARMLVGPHPHIGLHTVTWLVEGEVLHRDSLGTEQLIRPGQLNLMTAGHGVAHAEETPDGPRRGLHGAQLWVAQPEVTRHDPPAFEHHGELPTVGAASASVTVLVGALGDVRSPARTDTPLVGLAVTGAGRTELPLEATFEHAVVVLDGAAAIGADVLRPGELAYLAPGRHELVLELEAGAHVLVLGGEPFPEAIRMWWNFVGRTQDELDRAGQEWNAGDGRFGEVGSALPRIPAPTGR